MSEGAFVLNATISASLWTLVKLEDQLSYYVRCLASLVLVPRCLAAILVDIFVPEESAALTKETLNSSWHDMALAKKLLDIEIQWHTCLQILEVCFPKLIESVQKDMVSIAELRTYSSPSASRCSFTLLPLLPQPALKMMTPVVWKKKKFLTCVANFLEHHGL